MQSFKIKKNIKKLINIFSILILLIFFYVTNIKAQEKQEIIVFPAIQDVNITPGKKTRTQVQFRNNSDSPITGTIKVADFVIKDNSGTPIIIEDPKIPNKYGASSWVTTSQKKITIPPKDFVTTDIYINTPSTLNTCSKHIVIFLETKNYSPKEETNERKSQTITTNQLGAIINLIAENTQCIEDMKIINIKTSKFQEYGPIKINFSLLNLGNLYITPAGKVYLYNHFNKLVDQSPIEKKRIFPEARKDYEIKLGEKWMLGKYKVVIEASTNTKNPVIRKAEAYIWVIPYKLIIVISLTLVILIYLIHHFYKTTIAKQKYLEEKLKEEEELLKEIKKEMRSQKDK